MTSPLNAFIDEIADAPTPLVRQLLRSVPHQFYEDVCCTVEYEFFRRYTRPDLPPLSEYSRSETVEAIARVLNGSIRTHRGLFLQAVDNDVLAIPRNLGPIPEWVSFKKRAEASAVRAGFPELVGAAIAGAIHEMADNIVQHSQADSSGIAAFRANGDTFEYIIADAGVGMLGSLRLSEEFSGLRDDLEALSLAVLPGISRFGRASGRGYGFRAVFAPLKGTTGAVRLRSGRGVLSVCGSKVMADQARCAQRPHHQGVVVAVRISSKS